MSLSYVVDGETELDSELFNPWVDHMNGLQTGALPIALAGIAGALGGWLPFYDPRAYGAVCNGVTDDRAALQLMLNDMATNSRAGGLSVIPAHTRVVGTLHIKSENVQWVGLGRRNLQTYPLTLALADAPPTIIHEGTDPLFKLSHSYPINGFSVRDLTIAHSGSRTVDTIAFDFDLAGDGAFARDFLFENVSVTGFYCPWALRATSAEGSGSSGQLGAVRIQNSNIMHNTWIAQCRDGKWFNGFYFHHNDAGQNGYSSGEGGLVVTGHNTNILENVLEGMRDTIRVRGVAGRGLRIAGNYFEANVGTACIEVGEQYGPFDIGPNFFGAVGTTHKVLLQNVGGGRCVDRWWPSQVSKVSPLPNAIVGTHPALDEMQLTDAQIADTSYVTLVSPDPVFLAVPKGASAIRADAPSAPVPAPSAFGSAGQLPVSSTTLTSNGRITYSYTGYAGTADEIIVASFLFRLSDARGDSVIYVQISPDGVPGDGYDGAVATDATYFLGSEWRLLTVGCVASDNWTNLTIGLYPYGLNATGVTGKIALHRPPTVYKAASANCVQPYIYAPYSASAIPSGGAWALGDQIINSAPSAAGAERWVCTTAGTPGTWKAVNLEP